MPLLHKKTPLALRQGVEADHDVEETNEPFEDSDVYCDSHSCPRKECGCPHVKMAEGGEVESDDDDSELHDMLGKELMSALDAKDHKGIMQSLEAVVLSHLSKASEE